MSNASTKKTLKNYLYDNPDLKEIKSKKGCAEIDDLGSDSEVWLFQCPKNFDPKTLLKIQLAKISKESNMECSADRFDNMKTLAVIAPEKVREYEIICDNLKLVS